MGVWLPDRETHLVKELTKQKGTYQLNKLKKALEYVCNFNVCLDIGAHVGLWTINLCLKFKTVHAFEPVKENIECFKKNVTASNVRLHEYALGNCTQSVNITPVKGQTGSGYVDGTGSVPMKILDNLGLKGPIGFIKIDTEGYEEFVVRGGVWVIKRDKPVIIVEQKPSKGKFYGKEDDGAVTLLEQMGYEQKERISGDYIMIPKEG